MSAAFAERLERIEIETMADRMTAIREREGNPEGVEIRRFGGCTAFYSQNMPWPSFNHAAGIGPQDAEHVDDIVRFYRERKRAFEFRIVPNRLDAELARRLASHGFMQTGFHATLYAEADAYRLLPDAPPGLTFREIRDDEFDVYGRIHCLGFGIPEDGAVHIARNNKVLYGRPGWRIFLGFADGVPAAAGVMHMRGDAASLTFAATLPAYRNRGLQLGLIRKRMEAAAEHGCRLIVAQAAFASQSHRNMERAGMKLAYTRATWTAVASVPAREAARPSP